MAAFTPACNGRACIPQLGTNQSLDSLADRLMYRLAYRNFGNHDSLVVNHSVTTGSGVGIRWYELQNPNTNPVVFQHRDVRPHLGGYSRGYSTSSSSIHPATRYTGRTPADPLGVLQAESSIIEGTGSQLSGLSRWGDYSSMSVDPVDDCTFWYTTEYLQTDGTFNWNTRIASFKFPGCGAPPSPDFTLTASPSSETVVQGASTSYTVTVSPSGGFNGTVTFGASGLPSGASASFSPASVAGSGTSTLTVFTSATTPAGSYPVTITGTSGTLTHTAAVTLVVTSAGGGDFTISASPSSQTVLPGASTTYTVTVTPSGGFNGTVSLSVSGLPARAAGSFTPATVTASGTSTLTVSTHRKTPTGSSVLTITGIPGSLVHSTTVTLVVQ